MTSATNTQASEIGPGWSNFADAFIERRFDPCFETLQTPDMYWNGENATISLGGIGGALVPVNADATRWQLLSDPGWKIERDNLAHTTQDDWTQFKQRWKGHWSHQTVPCTGSASVTGQARTPGRFWGSTSSPTIQTSRVPA